MNLGFITIQRNYKAFAKLHWLLFKLFKIKRTIPCGALKKQGFIHCSLTPTKENSYLICDGYNYEVRCKCCDGLQFRGVGHPKTFDEALRLCADQIFRIKKIESTLELSKED